MTKSEIISWLIIGYMVVYGAAVVGAVSLARWMRRTRWPFKEEDKLLRGPGEELKRRIGQSDEKLVVEFVAGITVPVFAFFATAQVCARVAGLNAQTSAWIALFVLALCVVASAWRIVRLWRQRSNDFLGWFGERFVAQWLEPLKAEGWKIIHDVPGKAGGRKFNIDHVAVGPGGVFAVETKARRKGRARPGYENHVVFFDGRALEWPWGRDDHGLEQAERNAAWLAEWIKTEMGERVHVSPILALPGWKVKKQIGRDAHPAKVVNPKWLPDDLGPLKGVLSVEQIINIANKLK